MAGPAGELTQQVGAHDLARIPSPARGELGQKVEAVGEREGHKHRISSRVVVARGLTYGILTISLKERNGQDA